MFTGVNGGYIYTYGAINTPTVLVSSTSVVDGNTLTFNGFVNTENTTRGFEYGLTSSYGSTTVETGSFISGNFSATAYSLTPNTLYHYRAYATNANGTSYSSDNTIILEYHDWTQQTAAGQGTWQKIASSADGSKLVASYNGTLITSTDYGVSWASSTNDGTHYYYWTSISSSADGKKLLALDGNTGVIYRSNDSGTTWSTSTIDAVGDHFWSMSASSADGTKLVIGESGAYIGHWAGGPIYTSTDSGATWTEQTGAGQHGWRSIASSADGTKLAAIDQGGYIYTSTDSGVTWIQQTGSGQHQWYSITSSADGTKLAALDNGNGYLYTSTDSGVTWTENINLGTKHWGSITSSADGLHLVAVTLPGYVYTSNDGGNTWLAQVGAGTKSWSSVVSSSDGTHIIAIESGSSGSNGYIHTYYNDFPIAQALSITVSSN